MKQFFYSMGIIGLTTFFFWSCSANRGEVIAVKENETNKEKVAKVMRITDQKLLAKIAVEDKDGIIRSAAVGKLTDQTLLTKIAVEDDYYWVRETALKKITNQALLVKLIESGKDQYVSAWAAAELDDSNPDMRRLAGDLKYISYDAVQSIARIKMAIIDPIIKKRIPDIEFEVELQHIEREYTEKDRNIVSPSTHTFDGMSVIFKLRKSGIVLVQKEWNSYAPPEANLPFIHVEVENARFLADLFHLNLFYQEDLEELSKSEIPEVRKAAMANQM